jgi:mRNA interferase HigB
MQVIALRTLKQFWRLHSQAEIPLKTWYGVASQGAWDEFGPAVDFIAGNRVIFDIAGNKYRLMSMYPTGTRGSS